MASAEEQSCSDNPQGMTTSSPVSQAFNMEGEGHYVPERVYNIDEETRMVPDMPINTVTANATARHVPKGALLKVATSVPPGTALQPSAKSPSNFSALSFIASEYGESDTSSKSSSDSQTPVVGEQPTVPDNSVNGADGNSSAGFQTAEVSLRDNLETVSMSMDTQCEVPRFQSAENIFTDKEESLVNKTVTENDKADIEHAGVATPEGQFLGKSTAEEIELLIHADPGQNNEESALEPMETEELNRSNLKEDAQDMSMSMSVDMSEYSKEISNMDSILTGADESQSVSSMACSAAPKRKGPGAIPFVEYANLSVPVASEGDVSLSNITFIDEGSNQSNSNLTEKSSRPKRSRLEVQDVGFEHQDGLHIFPAEKLFEYQWPQDGGEWYLLQEQVSEYLGVLSFKRKYPDLTRRPCEALEKDFLREKGVVTETQSDLGLTAVRSDEIYDLMLKDYPDKYHEYATVIHEREKQKISTKHKEYEEAQERLEKSKMAMYMKKAAKSASDFNRNFLRDRREERTAYFDLQTFRIHYQAGRFKKLSVECTKPSAYPVALMPGQFQDHYCSFTSDELRYLPINTALFDPPKKMKTTLARPAAESDETGEEKSGSSSESSGSSSSDSENVTGDKNTAISTAGPANGVIPTANSASSSTNNSAAAAVAVNDGNQTTAKTPTKKLLGKLPVKKLVGTPPVKTPGRRGGPGRGHKKVVVSREEGTTPVTSIPASPALKKEEGEVEEMDVDKCRICKSAVLFLKYKRVETKMIKCSECGKIAHPSCLDLTEKMVQVVTTYPWQCMECKTCVECMDPYDEDKMLFCDRCDRGYHTFCVGLRCLPTGRWECRSCKGVAEASKIARRGRGRGRGRGSRGGRGGGIRSGVAQTADASTETADTSVNTDPFDDMLDILRTASDVTAGSAASKMPSENPAAPECLPSENADEPTDVTETATAATGADDAVMKKEAGDESLTESGSNNLIADVSATEDRSPAVAEPSETLDLAPQLTEPDVDKTDAGS